MARRGVAGPRAGRRKWRRPSLPLPSPLGTGGGGAAGGAAGRPRPCAAVGPPGPRLGAARDPTCGSQGPHPPPQRSSRSGAGVCAGRPRPGEGLCGPEGRKEGRRRSSSHVTCAWVITPIARGIELCSLTRCRLISRVKIIWFVRKKCCLCSRGHLKQCLVL